MQILQDQPIRGSLQDALGTGLQQLAHLKMQQLHQRHQQKQSIPGLAALGIPKDTAEQLALLPPELQSVVVKNFLQGAENAGLGEALSGIQGQQVPLQAGQPMGGGAPSAFEPMSTAPTQAAQPKSFTEILKNPRLKPEHRLRIAEMQQRKDLAEKAASEKKTAAQYKETKAFRQEALSNAKAARERLHDLERMEELDKSGKLDTPGYMEFLKRSGLDISALKNPESQEFEKMAAGFMRDAKNYFGSRISNYEIEQFLKAIPSLSQSPEGRKRVIANLKRVSRGAVLHSDAMKKVISDNNGVPPYDLMEKVDDITAKKMDTLSRQFKTDIERAVPEGQNRLITAAQAGLGSLLGMPGQILGKIGNIGSNLLGG